MVALFWRSWALWLLGYPEAALSGAGYSLKDAREIGQAGTLMFALANTSVTQIFCGNYATADTQSEELVALADKKATLLWHAIEKMNKGSILALTGKASAAVQTIIAGITEWRQTGGTLLLPWYLSNLAMAYGELGQFDDAWRSIGEAMTAVKTTKETWCEADILRIAGEIAQMAPEPDPVKSQTYFEQALAVAREQGAKSLELRAAMSMARLWRAQGKRDEARDLLAPVYGWFTEGFDTLDLKEAKTLLEELT